MNAACEASVTVEACPRCHGRRNSRGGSCPLCRAGAQHTTRTDRAGTRQCVRCGCVFPPRCTCSGRLRAPVQITCTRQPIEDGDEQ